MVVSQQRGGNLTSQRLMLISWKLVKWHGIVIEQHASTVNSKARCANDRGIDHSQMVLASTGTMHRSDKLESYRTNRGPYIYEKHV